MLDVGTPAPDFTLRDQNQQPVTLSDFRDTKNVLLVFFPLAFTGICQGELDEIRDHLPDYENDVTQTLAISVVVSWDVTTRLASPKSSTLARPALVITMFCDFRSRCSTPWMWA